MTDRIQRGKRVERLLNDADFMAALADIEVDIMTHMRQTAWDEAAMREVLHAEFRALQRIHFKLRAWADEANTD